MVIFISNVEMLLFFGTLINCFQGSLMHRKLKKNSICLKKKYFFFNVIHVFIVTLSI